MAFINRERELAALEAMWQREGAQLMVVYGRRRTGKTALLHAFTQDKPTVFWTAEITSATNLLRSFSRTLWDYANPQAPASEDFAFGSWEQALRYTGQIAEDKRVAVVLDEFPYLAGAQPGIPSLLQRLWDERLGQTNLFLVLCGSHIGMMEREVLAYRAPLYGRRTGQLLLRPLSFSAARQFFPRYSPVQQVTAYAVLGGTPGYLQQFTDRQPIAANIEERILTPTSFLYYEPQFLLQTELRDPRNYMAILQAIATGHNRLADICRAAGIDRGQASRSLATLRDLHLVERRVPATERQPEKSRKGRYLLRDNFLRFWFRFVLPFQEFLDLGRTDRARKTVEDQLPAFVARAFEDLCREWVLVEGDEGRLPFYPERVGAWWGPGAE
ncbi:MAG: ATP-binding protein, partial [Anaerolineae bacterium]